MTKLNRESTLEDRLISNFEIGNKSLFELSQPFTP